MQASTIILATVKSDSCDDDYGRVKISADDIWEEFGPVMVLNSIPLAKDDIVFVDIASGFENPVVVGRYPGKQTGEVLLWESKSGSDWTNAKVLKNKLIVSNSDGVSLELDGKNVKVTIPSSGKFTINSLFEVST